MSTAVVADTHTLVWHFLKSAKLSPTAMAAISQASLAGEQVYVASVSIVELAYLVEIGSLAKSTAKLRQLPTPLPPADKGSIPSRLSR